MGQKREETLNCFSPSMYAHFFSLFSLSHFLHTAQTRFLGVNNSAIGLFSKEKKKLYVCVRV